MEKEVQGKDFWQNSKKDSSSGLTGKEKAIAIVRELNELKEETKKFNDLKKELADIIDLKNLQEDEDYLSREIEKLEKKIEKQEFRTFLFGKYDKGSAVLSVYAGTGGYDAQDWTAMLFRMYEKYCFLKGFQTKVLNSSFGEGVGPEGRIGIKSASMEIKGSYAYGFLKKENGVHRLVRISPFSTKQLRHTSFALVEILPEIKKEDKIEIKPDNLKIDTYKASGPGGQNVNKRETSVRITHLPTGIVVACQSEREQGSNRKKAMEMISAKLFQLKEKQRQTELKKIKKESALIGQAGTKNEKDNLSFSPSWGNQIRSYVLHPYQMVKDLRTKVEVSNVQEVLEGKIDQFIEQAFKI